MTETPQPVVPATRWHPRFLFFGVDGLVRSCWRAVLFIVLALLLIKVVQGLLYTLFMGRSGLVGPFIQSAGFVVVWLLLSWALLAVLDRRSFRALGLWFYSPWAREFAVGIGIGAGMICVVVAIQSAFGVVHYLGVTANPAVAIGNTGRLAAMFFVAAAAEEILFRGYGFQRLVDSVGRVAAIGIFSALFGAVHLNNPSATWLSTINTVLAGVLLAVAYLKTRALWMPIGLHWAWNYCMTAVLSLPVSGFQFGEKLFRVELTGPLWLSGGSYGPEGSVVLTVVGVAAIIFLARTGRVSPSAAMLLVLESPRA